MDLATLSTVCGQLKGILAIFAHSIKFFLPSLYPLGHSHDVHDQALYAKGSSKVTNYGCDGREPGDQANLLLVRGLNFPLRFSRLLFMI